MKSQNATDEAGASMMNSVEVKATADKSSIGFIDQMRGVAVLCVFAFHSLGVAFGTDHIAWAGNFRDFSSVTRTFYLFSPIALGSYGVAVFFVISGFCIHLSYERSNKSWIEYASRRFFRIYPPYLLALVLIILGGLAFKTRVTTGDVISHLFLWHNLHENTFFTINPSFWSIATEVQLYMLYPLLKLLAVRFSWSRVCIGALAIETTLRIVRGVDGDLVPFWILESPISYFGSWTLGAWAADRYLQQKLMRTNVAISVLLVLLLLGCYYYRPLVHLTFTLASLLTVVAIQNRIVFVKAPSGSVLRLLSSVGVVSYSIYLFHQPILRTVGQWLTSYSPTIHPVFVMVLCGVVFIPVAIFSNLTYRFVEMPAAAMHKRIKSLRMT